MSAKELKDQALNSIKKNFLSKKTQRQSDEELNKNLPIESNEIVNSVRNLIEEFNENNSEKAENIEKNSVNNSLNDDKNSIQDDFKLVRNIEPKANFELNQLDNMNNNLDFGSTQMIDQVKSKELAVKLTESLQESNKFSQSIQPIKEFAQEDVCKSMVNESNMKNAVPIKNSIGEKPDITTTILPEANTHTVIKEEVKPTLPEKIEKVAIQSESNTNTAKIETAPEIKKNDESSRRITFTQAKKEIEEFTMKIDQIENEILQRYNIRISDFNYDSVFPEEFGIKVIEEYFKDKKISENK